MIADTCLVVEVYNGRKRLARGTGLSAGYCRHGDCPEGSTRVQIRLSLECGTITECTNSLYRVPHHRELHGPVTCALCRLVCPDRAQTAKTRTVRPFKRFRYIQKAGSRVKAQMCVGRVATALSDSQNRVIITCSTHELGHEQVILTRSEMARFASVYTKSTVEHAELQMCSHVLNPFVVLEGLICLVDVKCSTQPSRPCGAVHHRHPTRPAAHWTLRRCMSFANISRSDTLAACARV